MADDVFVTVEAIGNADYSSDENESEDEKSSQIVTPDDTERVSEIEPDNRRSSIEHRAPPRGLSEKYGLCGRYKELVKYNISSIYRCYGTFVGTYPLPFVMIPIVILSGLGMGLLAIKTESNLEEIYFPINNRAVKDRKIVSKTFPNVTLQTYNPYSGTDTVQRYELLFNAKSGNLLVLESLREIGVIVDQVKNFQVNRSGVLANQTFSCARECLIDGEYLFRNTFLNALFSDSVTYPMWTDPTGKTRDLSTTVSAVVVRSGRLVAAQVLRVSFRMMFMLPEWDSKFEELASELDPVGTKVAYALPDSMSEELDKSSQGESALFVATFVLCFAHVFLVTSGGNPVSTRCLLALPGILAAGLSIIGSIGLLSFCGYRFANVVGALPFVIVGIGLGDVYLMMSAWGDTLGDSDMTVPARLGACMANSGVDMTMSFLTDFLAFIIGTTSVFYGVTSFSLYAGVAILFSYLANNTMFAACLAFHGRRVYSSRHFLTCKPTKTRGELLRDGMPAWKASLLGGAIPTESIEDDSLCERLPRFFLPTIIEYKVMCVIIILGFIGYLSASIYGAVNLKQGVPLQDLVHPSSYYYKYLYSARNYFPESLPISFVINSPVDYSGPPGDDLKKLLSKAREEPLVISDVERCWLFSYLNSTYYDQSAPKDFVKNLQDFISATLDYQTDVVFDTSGSSVTASRCFVLSEKSNDDYAQADLMVRLRDLADDSTLPVFAYHHMFPFYEQFLAVLPAVLKLLGYAVLTIGMVTFVFLQDVRIVCFVVLNILMILLGIMGFMYYWDITLSPITMIQLLMSVGFAVDFSAHVSAAYLVSEHARRHERAVDAVRRASGPVLNEAMSTLLGVLILGVSEFFLFVTFSKIMLLVIVLSIVNTLLFLPAALALVGPHKS